MAACNPESSREIWRIVKFAYPDYFKLPRQYAQFRFTFSMRVFHSQAAIGAPFIYFTQRCLNTILDLDARFSVGSFQILIDLYYQGRGHPGLNWIVLKGNSATTDHGYSRHTGETANSKFNAYHDKSLLSLIPFEIEIIEIFMGFLSLSYHPGQS